MVRRAAPLVSTVAVTVAALALLVAACGERSGTTTDAGGDDGTTVDEPLPPLDGATSGYALSFDGTDDYASAGNGGFVPVSDALAIEMWVNIESGATDQDFIALRLNFESGVRIGVHAGTIAVRRVYVDRVLAQAALPSTNAWHHVAYTFDLTTDTLYIDGVEVDAQALPTDTRTPNLVWLGSIDGVNNLFRGKMDEVRVWRGSRSAAEVQTDMRHGVAAGQTNLVAYWTFDDDRAGGRSADSSGRGNDITLGDGIAQRMPSRVPSDAPTN
jgi:hypothetical protein